ncbi:MAG: hypothetical protein ACOX87_14235 [Chloroflexota bacterium]|jgi:hypothetical protein
MIKGILWKPGVTLVIGLLVGLLFGLVAAKNSDFGSLYGTAASHAFQGYVYEEGAPDKPIQGATVFCEEMGYDSDRGIGWIGEWHATTDANGFWRCEIRTGGMDTWSVGAALPASDTRTFSKVEAPGNPTRSGQSVSYQSLQGLPNPAEIKFYFKK